MRLDRVDALGRWFQRLEDSGEDITMRYGQLVDGDVRWHEVSHARFDGVGGFVCTVEKLGGAVDVALPELSFKYRAFRPIEAARVTGELLKRDWAGWQRLPKTSASQLVVHGLRAPLAFAVLGDRRLNTYRAAAARTDASLTGYLLYSLNATLVRHWRDVEYPALWVLPVNMRGAVPRWVPLSSNRLSFVPLSVRPQDDARRITKRLRNQLRSGSQYVFLAALDAAGSGRGAPSIRTQSNLLAGRSVGLFSNLGEWQINGATAGSAWVVCPPVTRFLPLGVGVVIVNNCLGLALQAHWSLTLDNEEVQAWMDGWISRSDVEATALGA